MNKLNIFRNCCPYRWTSPSYWLKNFKSLVQSFKFAWQRITRGYSDGDVWDLDFYLSKLLPAALRELAETSDSYPEFFSSGAICGSLENWQAYLKDAAMHFEAIDKEDDVFVNEKMISEIGLGFKMVSDMFFDLWD